MKIKTIILLLLVTIASYAQINVGNVTIDYGANIEESTGDIVQIGGISNGVIYALARKEKKYFIQSFEEGSKKSIKETSLKIDKINGNTVNIEDVAVIEDNVYVMASYYSRKTKENIFIAYPVAANLKLDPYKIISKVKVKNKKKAGQWLFSLSYDEFDYILIHVNIFDKEEKLTYKAKLLNEKLEEIKSFSHTESFKDRKGLDFDFADFGVNERGDVFMLLSESYRDKKNKTMRNTIMVHAYYAANEYQKEIIDIKLDDKKVINTKFIYTEDKLQILGFYSKLRKSGRSAYGLEGIFDIAVNTRDNTVSKKVFNDFTLETKTKLLGERRAKKGKDLKPFYKITSISERANGGVIILSEFYQKIRQQSGGIGIGPLAVAVTPIIYKTNEIIVTALDANGKLDWSNVIPKEQQASVSVVSLGLAFGAGNGNVSVSAAIMFPVGVMGDGPEYLSSLPIYNENKFTVIVNDDPKNVGITNMDDVKKVRNINKMVAVVFEFDEATGKMTRIDPENLAKKQIVLRPGVFYRKNNSELLIYGSNRKETRLGTLSVK